MASQQKVVQSEPHGVFPRDRFSWLWLAVAAGLLLFEAGPWTIPLAAWLAPLFLLRFVRTQRLLPGFILAWLVRSAIAAIVTQGTILYPGLVPYAIVLLASFVTTLPLLLDRLLVPRLNSFTATLVFPTAFTVVEYLSSFGPFGTYNSLAYSQYGNLPLMQLASVTGIWGITFMITWFAAVFNWAWERDFNWPIVQGGALLYAVLLFAVLFGGGARLAVFPPQANLVRVAGLSASQSAVAMFNQQMPPGLLSLLLSGKASQADRAIARSAFTIIDDDMLASSLQEARAGAKIIVWPEASPTGAAILQEDEAALLDQAGALAKQQGVYLDLGLAVFTPGGGSAPFARDQAILIDPTGKLVWIYDKTHPAPGDAGLFVIGNGKLPVVNSPYGRLANLICFDLDFPSTVRQSGQAGVDLMLGPSDDWQAVDPAHSQKATFRAIENGFSLVRQASKGLSIAVDYEGHVLAAADYFTTPQQVMVAYVPMHGVRTIYSVVGDLFVLLCFVGLLALTVLAVLPRRSHQSAVAAAPQLS